MIALILALLFTGLYMYNKNNVYLVLAIITFVFFLIPSGSMENFSSIDYSRVYPGIFSWNYINPRYSPGYRDYWYIPAHESLKLWVNGYQNPRIAIPPEYNEYSSYTWN
jgi:hypothetical protein